MPDISVTVINYPGSLLSAVYGLEETFWMANRASKELGQPFRFDCRIAPWPLEDEQAQQSNSDVIVLPPGRDQHFTVHSPPALIDWLKINHQKGTILSAACAGVFILAETGLLEQKRITTHWGLADALKQAHPELNLQPEAILINQGDVITAGGMMSWIDLALELIAQLASPAVMRRVGKLLLVDTGLREQRYYQQFNPDFKHGDQHIVTLQHILHREFSQPLTLAELATRSNLTERTMQRRFVKVTGLNPIQYLQRVRVQTACNLLESTQYSFESIAHQIGYEDVGACRKAFVKLMGLTPGDFRRRFSPADKQ